MKLGMRTRKDMAERYELYDRAACTQVSCRPCQHGFHGYFHGYAGASALPTLPLKAVGYFEQFIYFGLASSFRHDDLEIERAVSSNTKTLLNAERCLSPIRLCFHPADLLPRKVKGVIGLAAHEPESVGREKHLTVASTLECAVSVVVDNAQPRSCGGHRPCQIGPPAISCRGRRRCDRGFGGNVLTWLGDRRILKHHRQNGVRHAGTL